MDNDTRANNDTGANQQAAMPTADTKPEVETKEPVGESVSETKETTDELELPEGVQERTKEQFEKLKTELRSAKEKLGKLETQTPKETILEPFRAKPATQPQSLIDQAYDPNTGVIDINALKQMEESLNKTRTELEQMKYQTQTEKDVLLENEAYAVYPELKTDRDFYDRTQALLLHSIVNPDRYGGKSLTPKEAAERVKAPFAKVVEAAEKTGAQKALEQLTPKEQAGLEAIGRSDRRSTSADLATLSYQTRKGNIEAIVERLRNIPSV